MRALSRCRSSEQAGATCRRARIKDRVGWHASVLALARPTHHRRRALRPNLERHAVTRACESDFRFARSRWNPKSRSCDPRHESDALFFAARLRALGQLAVFGRTRYWIERLSF